MRGERVDQMCACVRQSTSLPFASTLARHRSRVQRQWRGRQRARAQSTAPSRRANRAERNCATHEDRISFYFTAKKDFLSVISHLSSNRTEHARESERDAATKSRDCAARTRRLARCVVRSCVCSSPFSLTAKFDARRRPNRRDGRRWCVERSARAAPTDRKHGALRVVGQRTACVLCVLCVYTDAFQAPSLVNSVHILPLSLPLHHHIP